MSLNPKDFVWVEAQPIRKTRRSKAEIVRDAVTAYNKTVLRQHRANNALQIAAVEAMETLLAAEIVAFKRLTKTDPDLAQPETIAQGAKVRKLANAVRKARKTLGRVLTFPPD